jgi:mannose-6-phosphate isomerase-like protein (cupin superfamily)
MIPFRRSILFSILGFFVPAFHGSPRRQDRASVIPDMKILFENEHVRVQFHDVKVGETTTLHSHPAYVAYVFNAYTGKAILDDGTEIPLARKPGEVFYNGPNTHKIVNTGNTPIHNLIIELKKVTK